MKISIMFFAGTRWKNQYTFLVYRKKRSDQKIKVAMKQVLVTVNHKLDTGSGYLDSELIFCLWISYGPVSTKTRKDKRNLHDLRAELSRVINLLKDKGHKGHLTNLFCYQKWKLLLNVRLVMAGIKWFDSGWIGEGNSNHWTENEHFRVVFKFLHSSRQYVSPCWPSWGLIFNVVLKRE